MNRCFKFLRFCCDDEEELTFEVMDFTLRKTPASCAGSSAVKSIHRTWRSLQICSHVSVHQSKRVAAYDFSVLDGRLVKTRKWGFHGSENIHDCRKVRLKLFDSDRDEHARTRWLHNICQTLAKPQCTLFWSLEMAVNTENCRLHEQIGVRRDRKLRSSDHSGNAKCRLLAATEQRVFSEDQMHTILP